MNVAIVSESGYKTSCMAKKYQGNHFLFWAINLFYVACFSVHGFSTSLVSSAFLSNVASVLVSVTFVIKNYTDKIKR